MRWDCWQSAGGMHPGGGVGMVLAWFLLVAVLALVAVVLFRQVRSQHASPPSIGQQDTAFDIARERFAKGELTREQFDELRRLLS